ncbi:PID domain-containing protein [Trichonephila clavipes]|nr:PID domain-containing protein [Trichonephila clavipes]
MKPYILSDRVIYRMKDTFEKEMTLGLEKPDKAILPMTVTFVTERFTNSEGDYVAICAHAQNFTITLMRLKNDALPHIQRRDYNIGIDFKQSYRKIYEAFAECVKDFFYEFQLDGRIIPVAFCSNLSMRHFSLDTAILPRFSEQSDLYPCQKDVKAYFEQILSKHNYQGNSTVSVNGTSIYLATEENSSSASHHAEFDAKYLGSENILGIDANPELCHKILGKMKVFLDAGHFLRDVVLDIGHTGIRIQDKSFKASQVFLTLKNFLNVAQDLKAKEREIPVILKKRVSLVENIFWWLEGCSGDITPVYLDREEWTLNVRIPELYTTAVTMKLIEKEQEEARIRAEKAAAKRHMRKKVEVSEFF